MNYVLRKSKHTTGTKASKAKARAIKTTQDIMSNYTITLVMADKDNKCSTVYYKDKPTKISPQLSWHFQNTRCNWDIICGVICRDQSGKHYINYVSFGSINECVLEDLSELAMQACMQLFEEAPRLHKLCPYYMARPQKECDGLLILDTIHQFEVLNLIGTNFEIDCNCKIVNYHTPEKWLEVLRNIQFNELELEFIDEQN